MAHETQTFVLADPRLMEGDPYEVAQRAVEQAAGMARLLVHAIHGADLMARNAMMERNIAEKKAPSAMGWDNDPVQKRLKTLADQAVAAEKSLTGIAKAAGHNPRKPLPKA